MEKLLERPVLKQKIDTAIKIMSAQSDASFSLGVNANDENHPHCFRFYISTNEDLYYFQRLAKFEGKDVLTVTASGDQAINSIFLGAKSVETFDINELAFLAYDLKQTAILHLSRDEFINFYSGSHLCKDVFDKKYYDKISAFLKPDTKAFFDGIFNFLEACPVEKRDRALLRLFEDVLIHSKRRFIQINPYLKNKASYVKTQNRIFKLGKPVTHQYCPLHKIGDKFAPKDIVIMSNILDYYCSKLYKDSTFDIDNQNVNQAFSTSFAKFVKECDTVSLLYDFDKNNASADKFFDKLGLKTSILPLKKNGRRVYVSKKTSYEPENKHLIK